MEGSCKINLTQKFKFILEKMENLEMEKEKMLVTRIFSFSNIVFKRPLPEGHL